MEEGPGDILAFLTGQEEIESIEKLIHGRLDKLPDDKRKVMTVPIYSSLPSEQQMNAFKPAPSGFRKVINYACFHQLCKFYQLTMLINATCFITVKIVITVNRKVTQNNTNGIQI